MLGGLLSSMLPVEQIVKDKIKDALQKVADEYGFSHNELRFIIQPEDEEYNFKVIICKLENGSAKIVRELTVKDIVGGAGE